MSKKTFQEAVKGSTAPLHILEQLKLITVPYVDFEGRVQTGQLIVHRDLSTEVIEIFTKLAKVPFPIERVILPDFQTVTGEQLMQENGTAAFWYRKISGTKKLSLHSIGRAVDINTKLNPYFGRNSVEPKGATYDPNTPGTMTKDSEVVRIFEGYGWTWLGNRPEFTDYMHFQKTE